MFSETTVPRIPGAQIEVSAWGSPPGGPFRTRACALAPASSVTSVTLDLPELLTTTTPSAGAVFDPTGAALVWQPLSTPGGAPVYFVQLYHYPLTGRRFSIEIMTARTSHRLPDLSPLAITIPAKSAMRWSVYAYGPGTLDRTPANPSWCYPQESGSVTVNFTTP